MIQIGSALDVGKKRSGNENQDSIFVHRPNLFDWRPALLVVADGMGGYTGGAIASQQVVTSLYKAYKSFPRGAATLDILRAGVDAAMDSLKAQAEQNPGLEKMGSTVVAAAVQGGKIYLINVGDSRAYLINQTAIRQVSYDHSLVAELTRQGLITPAEAREHPRRNVLSMSLTAQRDLVDPFIAELDWQRGDHLLLCSDGLWGPVGEAEIQQTVLSYPPQQAADRLVALANHNQGPDNISVIVARYR